MCIFLFVFSILKLIKIYPKRGFIFIMEILKHTQSEK